MGRSGPGPGLSERVVRHRRRGALPGAARVLRPPEHLNSHPDPPGPPLGARPRPPPRVPVGLRPLPLTRPRKGEVRVRAREGGRGGPI